MGALAVVCALAQLPDPVLSLSTLTFLSLSSQSNGAQSESADTFGLDLLMLRCTVHTHSSELHDMMWPNLSRLSVGLSNKELFLFPMTIVISPHYTLKISRTTFVLWALATPADLAKLGAVATKVKVSERLGHMFVGTASDRKGSRSWFSELSRFSCHSFPVYLTWVMRVVEHTPLCWHVSLPFGAFLGSFTPRVFEMWSDVFKTIAYSDYHTADV